MSKKILDQARAALESGQHASARDAITAYAQDNELSLQHFLVKGLAELGLSDWKGAAETFGAAVKRFHSNHECWAYLGLAQHHLKRGHDAMASFEKSLSLNASNGIAASNLAIVYRSCGRWDDALHMAHLGSRTHPDKPWAFNILGLALRDRGKFFEAQQIYEQALQMEPGNLEVLYNLATIHANQNNFAAAWPIYARAQSMSPAPHLLYGEGLMRIMAGDFEKGWNTYEIRLNDSGCLHARPKGERYHGQDLNGKTLALIHEQGLGDNLHFCRFGPLLDKKGAELIWVVEKPLKRLFEASFPGTVYTVNDDYPTPDYYLPILSMPLEIGCFTPDTWPQPPYLKAPQEGPQLPWNGQGPKVGLIWAGSPTHERDYHRSMPLKAFGPLFSQIRAQFYAPFVGPVLDQITDEPIIRLDHLIKDFADTAALMKQMDYVITVDSSPAHLAGGLGVRTYMMINYIPEWRWGFGGDKTAWYPNMTVIRQKSPGDWDSAVKQLVQRLL